ncbi:hypothetical protein BH11PSE3_BH11PSE3_03610 [soil metagenome]
MKARLFFWLVYGLLLLGVTVAATEMVAAFLVPSWPARDMRPLEVTSTPEIVYNDWALRDRPRSFARPPGVAFRSVLVGDSFLEGPYLKAPLSALVEKRLAVAGRSDMEAINFGVSATGPQQYYYRIKDVGLDLKPDAVIVNVYAGNDFISVRYGSWIPPLVAERPLPSLLGAVAPRTTWLAVNRLGLSEFGRGNKPLDWEYARLNEWLDLPTSARLDKMVDHLKQYYFPKLDEGTIREILSRGDGHFWTPFAGKPGEREALAGWLLSSVVDWETGQWKMPRDAAEAERLNAGKMVEETLSWLVAAQRLAKANGFQLVVALIPVGTGDPAYVDFWRLWPKYFSYALSADARHRSLAEGLRRTGVPVIDLRDDLNGIPGTYRLTDGHWTQKGTEIVADRLARELLKLRR